MYSLPANKPRRTQHHYRRSRTVSSSGAGCRLAGWAIAADRSPRLCSGSTSAATVSSRGRSTGFTPSSFGSLTASMWVWMGSSSSAMMLCVSQVERVCWFVKKAIHAVCAQLRHTSSAFTPSPPAHHPNRTPMPKPQHPRMTWHVGSLEEVGGCLEWQRVQPAI